MPRKRMSPPAMCYLQDKGTIQNRQYIYLEREIHEPSTSELPFILPSDPLSPSEFSSENFDAGPTSSPILSKSSLDLQISIFYLFLAF